MVKKGKLTKAKLRKIVTLFTSGEYVDVLRQLSNYDFTLTTDISERSSIYELVATTYNKLKRHELAVKFLVTAVAIKPNDINLKLKLATYCWAAKRLNEAKQILNTIEGDIANDKRFLLAAAEVSLRLREFGRANEYARQLLAQDPESAKVLDLRARIALNLLDYEHANLFIDEALRFSGKDMDCLKNAITIKIDTGKIDDALSLIDRALEIEDSWLLRFNKGYCLHKLGYQTESIEFFQVVLREFIDGNRKLGEIEKLEPENHQNLKDALLELRLALNKLDIPFFPLAGTFLGLHRDGGFLKNEKDIDIGLPWSTPRYGLLDNLKDFGFQTAFESEVRDGRRGIYCFPVVHIKTGVSIDLFFVERVDDRLKIGIDYVPPIIWEFDLFELRDQTFFGVNFLAPYPANKYLSQFYGPDWKKPNHFCAVLRSPSLTQSSRAGSISFGYNNLLRLIITKMYTKAIHYVDQMLTVVSDDLLVQTRSVLVNEVQQSQTNGEDNVPEIRVDSS